MNIGIFIPLIIFQEYQVCLICARVSLNSWAGSTSYCSEMVLNRAFLIKIWPAVLVKWQQFFGSSRL